MTEAQQAHLRILESLPRERVHTHEAKPSSETGSRPPHAVSAHRREWIKRHFGSLTIMEMAHRLRISVPSVRKHLVALGLLKPKKYRPRKNKL